MSYKSLEYFVYGVIVIAPIVVMKMPLYQKALALILFFFPIGLASIHSMKVTKMSIFQLISLRSNIILIPAFCYLLYVFLRLIQKQFLK